MVDLLVCALEVAVRVCAAAGDLRELDGRGGADAEAAAGGAEGGVEGRAWPGLIEDALADDEVLVPVGGGESETSLQDA